MKKYILVIIGIFLLAGLVFASTNTGLLQGNSRELGVGTDNFGRGNGSISVSTETKDFKPQIINQPTVAGEGGTYTPPADDDEEEKEKPKDSVQIESHEDKEAREETETKEYTIKESTNIATNSIKDMRAPATDTVEKGTPNLDQVSSGISFDTSTRGTTSTELGQHKERETPQGTIATEFFIYLEVLDEEGNFISGLNEDNFTADKAHKVFREQTSFYSFQYDNGYNIKYTLESDIYQQTSTSKITAIPSPNEAESVTLKYKEAPSCKMIQIGADGGSTLNVSLKTDSKDWDGTILVTNDNNTPFIYSGTSFAHNSMLGEIQFFINDSTEADIEFDATLTPGATFTASVVGEESLCTASFSVDQEETTTSEPETPEETETPDTPEVPDPGSEQTEQTSQTQTPDTPETTYNEPETYYEEYYTITPDVEQPEYETGEIYSCDHGFSDIRGTSNEATICWLAKEGVINGKTDYSFGYNENITVAEYLKILLILAGESPSSGRSSFTNGQHWGEGWLVRAEELDVLRARDGFPANVNHPITRGDAALYAMRLIQETYYPTSSPYTDVDTDDYFGYAVIYLSDLTTTIPQEGTRSVLEGYEDARFKPYSYIKRGEAVSLLSGMFFALFQ